MPTKFDIYIHFYYTKLKIVTQKHESIFRIFIPETFHFLFTPAKLIIIYMYKENVFLPLQALLLLYFVLSGIRNPHFLNIDKLGAQKQKMENTMIHQ